MLSTMLRMPSHTVRAAAASDTLLGFVEPTVNEPRMEPEEEATLMAVWR